MTNNQDGPKQARSSRSLCQKGPLAWKKYATAGSGGSDYYQTWLTQAAFMQLRGFLRDNINNDNDSSNHKNNNNNIIQKTQGKIKKKEEETISTTKTTTTTTDNSNHKKNTKNIKKKKEKRVGPATGQQCTGRLATKLPRLVGLDTVPLRQTEQNTNINT